MNNLTYEYCENSLSRRFPYESLSSLVNNDFTQVAHDLVRALVPSHGSFLDAFSHVVTEPQNGILTQYVEFPPITFLAFTGSQMN